MMRTHTLSLLALVALACASAVAAPAQEETRRQERAVTRVQEAVRQRILAERGGQDEYVIFNNDAQRVPSGFNQVGVRGTGVYYREGRGNRERRDEFNYSGVYNTRSNNVERTDYRFDNRPGGADRDVPNWLVGTFRGRNPSGRGRALVTVEGDGRVAVVYGDGTRESGRYRDRQLRIGNSVWNVSRNNTDGFRAQDNSSRRAEDFVRVRAGDDVGGGDVPSWAVGTFRGVTDSGRSELTINSDGSATARSLTNNTTHAGSYTGGRLRFDWGTFDVVREGDGIRTVDVNNRRGQTSYRRVGSGGFESNDGRVPRWAVGTFRGTSDSGEAELTIHADGTATIMPLSGTRTLHTGRYADGVLTFDWGTYNVVREPNGLRTVDVNNRRGQTSYRRVN